jgi:hypothetical protein
MVAEGAFARRLVALTHPSTTISFVCRHVPRMVLAGTTGMPPAVQKPANCISLTLGGRGQFAA